jgi:type 1 glutamine amidotransferase/HEAT repeat protein
MLNRSFKRAMLAISLLAGAGLAAVSSEEEAKIQEAMPSAPAVQPQQPRKMLVIDRCDGFKHDSIPYWDKVLEIMAAKTKAFEVTVSSDMASFSADNLKAYDAVCFNNTTHLTFTDDQKAALMDFVKSGKGIVGIHAATDNFYGWDEAAAMMGGQFVKHPWTSNKTETIKIDDPNHPLTRPFAGRSFKVNDEIYVTHPPFYGRDKQRVLMSLDMSDPNTRNVKGVLAEDYDTGISWVKSYGKGRVFYCSLGHNHPICWTGPILAHYLAGIQFALGDLAVDTTPLPAPSLPGGLPELAALVVKTAGYDFGQSTAGLLAIEKTLRGLQPNEADAKAAEQLLLGALGGRGSLAWKGFLCRQLSLVGSEASAESLMTLLKDETTADMARYALERIGGDKIRGLVRQALASLPPKTQIGVISTLGVWQDSEAVGLVAGFLKSPDEGLRDAATSSLGRIATDDAAEALLACMKDASGPWKTRIMDACLQCSQVALARGRTDAATQLYKTIYDSASQTHVRAAALVGWVTADRSHAGEILLAALQQPDQGLVVAACSLVSAVDGPAQRKKVAEYLTKVPEAGRVAMLASLARTGDRTILPLVMSAAQTEKGPVQIAAVQALASLGDASTVGFLASTAGASDGELRDTARDSLVQLRGDGVDQQILKAVSGARTSAQKELIAAIRQRRIRGADQVLIRLTASSDAGVRAAAFSGLAEIGDKADLPVLVATLIKNPANQDLEDAIVAIGRRIEDPASRSDAVLNVADSVKEPKARGAVLRVLGRLGSDRSLVILRKDMRSTNATIQTAAIRALADWPNPGPMQDLLDVARNSPDTTQHVLALRGYVRMAVMPAEVANPQKVAKLNQAMALAKRDDEKKFVLSTLAQCPCPEALDLAESAMASAGLGAEAETVTVQLCDKMAGQNPDKVKAVLNKIIAATQNESVRQQAAQILKKLN